MSVLEQTIPQRQIEAKKTVRLRDLSSDFTWTLLGNGVFSACQWGLLIVLAKLSSAEAVGAFALSQAIVAPVIMLASLHLRAIVASDLKNEYGLTDYLLFRVLTLAAALCAVFGIAVAASYPRPLLLLLLMVGLTQAVETASDMYYGLHQRYNAMPRIATSLMTKGPLGLLGLAAGFFWTQSIVGAACGLLISRILVLVAYDGKSKDAGSFAGLDLTSLRAAARLPETWKAQRKLFRLVFPLGIVAMLVALIGSIPRYFIGGVLGTRELGIFSAVASLISLGMLPASALGQAAFVPMARAYADRSARDFCRLLGLLLGIGMAGGAAGVVIAKIGGPRLLLLLFRPEYAEHTELLAWVMAIGGVGFMAAVMGYAMTAARLYRPQVPLLALVAGTTAVGSALLIPRWGLHGAVLALLIAWSVQLAGSALVLFISFRQPAVAEGA